MFDKNICFPICLRMSEQTKVIKQYKQRADVV